MNKADVVSSLATKTGLSKKDSRVFLEAFVATVIESVMTGDKVNLVGFGSFEKKKRAARKGRNPQNNKTINIPASNAPVFRPGKFFKKKVNTAK